MTIESLIFHIRRGALTRSLIIKKTFVYTSTGYCGRSKLAHCYCATKILRRTKSAFAAVDSVCSSVFMTVMVVLTSTMNLLERRYKNRS